MRIRFLVVLFLIIFCAIGLSLRAEETSAPAETLPYLVALDFTSTFDKGALGKALGRMFRSKSHRRKLFVVDAEYEWGDRAGALKSPALDADSAAVATDAKAALGCDVLVWGEIIQPKKTERKTAEHFTKSGQLSHTSTVRKHTTLFFHVRAIDFRKDPPALVVSETYKCANNYELTAKVDEVLKLLTGAPTPADLAAAHERNFMKPFGPNLCLHGSLNRWQSDHVGTLVISNPAWRDRLTGWAFPMKDGIQPLCETIRLRNEDGSHPAQPLYSNSFFRYTLSENVAATTGLFCYTPYISIQPDTYYQASFRVKTMGPKVIMFVKGYRDISFPDLKTEDGTPVKHRQEVSKHQKRWYGEKGEWGTLTTQPFLPRSAKPEHMPQFLRVQLYAYYPKGEVFFDDIVVRACRRMGAEAKKTE